MNLRNAFHAIDAFVISEPVTFRAAFERLANTSSEVARAPFLATLALYELGLQTQCFATSSPLEMMMPGCAAPIWVTFLYMTEGSPLRLTDALVMKWGQDWGEVEVSQCVACHYVFPVIRRSCLFCGAGTGPVAEIALVGEAWVN